MIVESGLVEDDSQNGVDWRRRFGCPINKPEFDAGALTGQGIADFSESLRSALPNMRWRLLVVGEIVGGLLSNQCMIYGTNTGPFMDGNPSTSHIMTMLDMAPEDPKLFKLQI